MRSKVTTAVATVVALGILLVSLHWATGEPRPGPPGVLDKKPAVPAKVDPAAPSFTTEAPIGPQNLWEPTLVADPHSDFVYMSAMVLGKEAEGPQPVRNEPGTRVCPGCPVWTIGVWISADGGHTWGPIVYPCGGGCRGAKRWQADPTMAVDDKGRVYISFMDKFSGALLQRSTDHGKTWTRGKPSGGANFHRPIVVQSTTPTLDKPWLLVGPSGAQVYVAFNNGSQSTLGRPYVAVSQNGGLNFAPAVPNSVEHDPRNWLVSNGVVSPTGGVHFVQSAMTTPKFAGDIYLVSSRDRGVTWVSTKMSVSATPTQADNDASIPEAAIAADAAGTLMIAYVISDTENANKVLAISTSKDDGRSWSAPVIVNRDGDSSFPWIVAGPEAGDFRLAWADNRAGGDHPWNTWFTQTVDGGRTWTEDVRLSDAATGAPWKSESGYRAFYGDYLGMAVNRAGETLVVWGEGRGYQTRGSIWYARSEPAA